MSGWTLAALLGGFIFGVWVTAIAADTEKAEEAKAGAIVVHGVAYIVQPMKKEGE